MSAPPAGLRGSSTVIETTDITTLLRVGTSAQVQIGPIGTKILVEILGWQKDQFILVSMPDSSRLGSRDKAVLRFVHRGQAVAFKTKIITGQRQPQPVLFLEYPEKAEIVALRDNPRAEVSGKATLFLIGDASPHTVLVEDMSATGCGTMVLSPLLVVQPGLAVMLNLDIQGVGVIENVAGVIRNVRQSEEGKGNRTRMGVEFLWSESPQDVERKERLRRFVDRLIE